MKKVIEIVRNKCGTFYGANHWLHVNGKETVRTSNMRRLYRCEKQNMEDLKWLRRSYMWLS